MENKSGRERGGCEREREGVRERKTKGERGSNSNREQIEKETGGEQGEGMRGGYQHRKKERTEGIFRM